VQSYRSEATPTGSGVARTAAPAEHPRMSKPPQPHDVDAATAEVDLLLTDLGPAAPGAGRPVLVVESVAIARRFLLQRLKGLGYDVHSAENGERALAMVERRAYAIVFLELALEGGVDGLSLCQAIKQMPHPPGGIAPAVVFTTGQTGPTNRVRGSLAGCDAYLNKPLLEDELLAALRDVDPLFQ